MFSRHVSIHLKSNTLSDYTQAFEKEVLPLLRKQSGFRDEITFAGPGGVDLTAISLWENKADAEAYNTNTYPQVLRRWQDLSTERPRFRPLTWSARPSTRSPFTQQRRTASVLHGKADGYAFPAYETLSVSP